MINSRDFYREVRKRLNSDGCQSVEVIAIVAIEEAIKQYTEELLARLEDLSESLNEKLFMAIYGFINEESDRL